MTCTSDNTIALIERLGDAREWVTALFREARDELITLLQRVESAERDYHLVAQERDNLTHDLGKAYEQRASLIQRCEKAEAALEIEQAWTKKSEGIISNYCSRLAAAERRVAELEKEIDCHDQETDNWRQDLELALTEVERLKNDQI